MSLDHFTELSKRWRRINALWYKIFMSFLKETNLTYTEAIVLLAVYSLNTPTKSDISDYMRSEPQSITRAINSLMSKKLLIRYTDKNDKRYARFELTDAGIKFSVKTQKFINENWSDSLKFMDEDALDIFSKQLNLLSLGLEKIIKD